MTTIAWDGRSLAVDRLAVCANLRRSTRKLHVSKAWVYGGAGSLPDLADIALWLEAGAEDAKRPTLEEGGSCGIAVRRRDGRAFKVEGKRPVLALVRERFVADGSGRDFAIAAMALGRTARQAVALAARFDVYTGGGIDSIVVVPR